MNTIEYNPQRVANFLKSQLATLLPLRESLNILYKDDPWQLYNEGLKIDVLLANGKLLETTLRHAPERLHNHNFLMTYYFMVDTLKELDVDGPKLHTKEEILDMYEAKNFLINVFEALKKNQ